MNKLKELFKRNPFFFIFIIVIFIENITSYNGSFFDWFVAKLLILPGIIIGLTFHEAAHAYASYRLGDPTPKNDGRLSLNPKDHIDPIGFIFLLIAGFGWGESVRIDPRYYKHMRRDELFVSLSGVLTNFIIAVIFSFIVKGLALIDGLYYTTVGNVLFTVLLYVIQINLILMIFNLIPCPPLDGWGVITQIFHLQKYQWWYKIYRWGSMILMGLIIFNITSYIVSPLVSVLYRLLLS